LRLGIICIEGKRGRYRSVSY